MLKIRINIICTLSFKGRGWLYFCSVFMSCVLSLKTSCVDYVTVFKLDNDCLSLECIDAM